MTGDVVRVVSLLNSGADVDTVNRVCGNLYNDKTGCSSRT